MLAPYLLCHSSSSRRLWRERQAAASKITTSREMDHWCIAPRKETILRSVASWQRVGMVRRATPTIIKAHAPGMVAFKRGGPSKLI